MTITGFFVNEYVKQKVYYKCQQNVCTKAS